jgi:hypothetical protein
MISILKWPSHLKVRVLPFEERKRFVNSLKEYTRINKNNKNGGFLQETEIDQINRLCEYMSEDNEDAEIKNDRIDFKNFIVEYDYRKKTNFKDVFPKLNKMLIDNKQGKQ